MAGIPLKSGADFYNLEASRMRLHNLGADPTEYGLGQIYYNSSTGSNTSGRARLYTGNGFHSLAFMEDIDSINEKLDLIFGEELDTDGIISSWKEVQDFLDQIPDTKDLMDMLNGKLDKTGGTIENNVNTPLSINSTSTVGTVGLSFKKNGTEKGSIGYTDNQGMSIYQSGKYLGIKEGVAHFDGNTLLHSGNVGEYKAGNSNKLEGYTLYWVQCNGRKFNRKKIATHSNQADANADLVDGGMIYSYSGLGKNTITNSPSDMQYGHIWQVGSYGNDDLDGQFAWDINNESTEDVTRKLWWRARDSSNGWTYAKWHQIAFTDSDITGSVLNSDGDLLLAYNNGLLLGYGSAAKSKNTSIYGNSVVMRYSSNRTQGFILNSSGNVTIGGSDLAGTSAKLYVDGSVYVGNKKVLDRVSNNLHIGEGIRGSYDTSIFGTNIIFNTSSGNGAMMIALGGNVGIGTLEPDEKLHVVGNLHVTGNIIADGEVSAGGAGTESGEGGTTGGGGDALIYSQEFTPSTTTVSIAHNLSSTKGVIVQVWEKDTTAGTWNMVLVDVEEVDSNNIKLNFGRTETILHKVVVMG